MTDAQYRQAEEIELIPSPFMFPSADYLRRVILSPPLLRSSDEEARLLDWADDRTDPQEDQPCEQC